MARYGNPAQTAPTAPMLIVQGTDDEAVPYFVTEMLLEQLAPYRQPVRFVTVEGANHDGAVFQTVDLVANWIAVRLA
jgi:fermentation-respiration switch protein FrsA (DUF1100 family)